MHGQEHIKNLRVQARGQLDEEHIPAQGVPQDAGLPAGNRQRLRPQHQPSGADLGGQRPVDALKGVKAGGAGLDRPAAQNHLPVKGHKHAPNTARRHGKGGAQVLQSVGQGVLDGQLRAREHHRNLNAPEHKGEHRGGVGHGVGAVGDDDAVKIRSALVHRPGDDLPLLRLDVGGVHTQQIPDGQAVIVRQAVQACGHAAAVQTGRQALLCGPGGNGASGGEKQNLFHKSLSLF